MDSLTHALVITIVLVLIGRPDLALYGILGAVLIDIDAFFNLFSDRDPRLYIFTHGGFTHSFLGAFTISLLAAAIAVPLSMLAPVQSFTAPFGLAAFAAILAGAVSHIAIDYLAYPGIPLFYPASDKKYTLGILAGPSAFIMAASIAYFAAMATGLAQIGNPWIYIAFFAIVLAMYAGARALLATRVKGRTIATMSPLKWMVIENTPDAFLFYTCDLFGRRSNAESYKKYTGIKPPEARKYEDMPEVKRVRYHSYVVAVEKNGDGIVYRDPIREKGHIWYPPYFKNHCVMPDDVRL